MSDANELRRRGKYARNTNPDATLSPLEQRIYFAARNAKDGVISLEIIRSWNLTDDNTLWSTLSKMIKKGWLISLRRGIYLVSQPNTPVITDIFKISTYMFPGYNAFSAALYIHGLSDMVPFEVYVATRDEKGLKSMGNYTIKAIPIKERYSGVASVRGYVVSTIPKTIYDSLIHPDLSGGYPMVLKAIYEAKLTETDWNEVIAYAEKSDNNSFFQRLGHMLEILPKKNNATKKMIEFCLEKVKSVVHLQGRSKGKYIPKWKLMDNIGKEKLISWWY